MNGIALAVAFLLLGCAATVPEHLSDDPETAMREVGREYEENRYDCDDMAQVYRDYLEARGEEDVWLIGLRLVWESSARHMAVLWDGLICDPTSGAYRIPLPPWWEVAWLAKGVVWDGSGYSRRGDRFWEGMWR
jgi:hypothetical protein